MGIEPNEKAKQLINRYLILMYGKKQFYKKSDYFKAKKAVLICINEIVEIGTNPNKPTGLSYWNKVKKEIEELKTI